MQLLKHSGFNRGVVVLQSELFPGLEKPVSPAGQEKCCAGDKVGLDSKTML